MWVQGHDTPANGFYLKLLDLFYFLRALRALTHADILITNTFWLPILASWCQRCPWRIVVDVQRTHKWQMRFYRRVDWMSWLGILSDELKWGSFRCAELISLPSHQENLGIVIVESKPLLQ